MVLWLYVAFSFEYWILNSEYLMSNWILNWTIFVWHEHVSMKQKWISKLEMKVVVNVPSGLRTDTLLGSALLNSLSLNSLQRAHTHTHRHGWIRFQKSKKELKNKNNRYQFQEKKKEEFDFVKNQKSIAELVIRC